MHVPVMYLRSPEQQFWLTDDSLASPSGQPVLIDASGRVYHPAEARGVMCVNAQMCRVAFYDAVRRAGYQLEWID